MIEIFNFIYFFLGISMLLAILDDDYLVKYNKQKIQMKTVR